MTRRPALRRAALTIMGCAPLVACSTHGIVDPTPSLSVAHSAAAAAEPTGVPAAVYAAARRILDTPGNVITRPVEWVQTTFGAWQAVADPASKGTEAEARAPVYVVQVQGTFVNSFSHTVVVSSAAPLSVQDLIVPMGPPVSGVTAGWAGPQPVDLAKIAPVHTFALP